VGTRGGEIPAKQKIQDGVGWSDGPTCFRARGPVVDPLLIGFTGMGVCILAALIVTLVLLTPYSPS
jgi:hypothetical protein